MLTVRESIKILLHFPCIQTSSFGSKFLSYKALSTEVVEQQRSSIIPEELMWVAVAVNMQEDPTVRH